MNGYWAKNLGYLQNEVARGTLWFGPDIVRDLIDEIIKLRRDKNGKQEMKAEMV